MALSSALGDGALITFDVTDISVIRCRGSLGDLFSLFSFERFLLLSDFEVDGCPVGGLSDFAPVVSSLLLSFFFLITFLMIFFFLTAPSPLAGLGSSFGAGLVSGFFSGGLGSGFSSFLGSLLGGSGSFLGGSGDFFADGSGALGLMSREELSPSS